MKSERFSIVKTKRGYQWEKGERAAKTERQTERMAERRGWYSVYIGEGGDIESKKETVEIFIEKPKREGWID